MLYCFLRKGFLGSWSLLLVFSNLLFHSWLCKYSLTTFEWKSGEQLLCSVSRITSHLPESHGRGSSEFRLPQTYKCWLILLSQVCTLKISRPPELILTDPNTLLMTSQWQTSSKISNILPYSSRKHLLWLVFLPEAYWMDFYDFSFYRCMYHMDIC